MISPYFQSENFILYHGDCIEILKKIDKESVNMVFADPPYFLSNNGFTCHRGKRALVNKGEWDKFQSINEFYKFNKIWLQKCKRVLNRNSTIWVSGTFHNIYLIGFLLQKLNFKILNNITWQKPNPPPNLSCRYFTHSTETILWAKQIESKHCFNYKKMKKLNNDKQMKDVWCFSAPAKKEKLYGKHPTQKPISLLDRIIISSTNKGDVILDPFCGSGTSIISAIELGRKCIGIEKEKKYCDLTIKRYKGSSKNEK